MDKRLPEESHEWKSIRSELCGMLETRLDPNDETAERPPCQRGRGYVRLRTAKGAAEVGCDLLRLKHQERVRRARSGPFDLVSLGRACSTDGLVDGARGTECATSPADGAGGTDRADGSSTPTNPNGPPLADSSNGNGYEATGPGVVVTKAGAGTDGGAGSPAGAPGRHNGSQPHSHAQTHPTISR